MNKKESISKNCSERSPRKQNPIIQFKQNWQKLSDNAGLIAKQLQIFFLFILMISQGIFFLSSGLKDEDKIQTLICGIYLISLSFVWIFLLFFMKKRKKSCQSACYSPSSSSIKSQKSSVQSKNKSYSYNQNTPHHTKHNNRDGEQQLKWVSSLQLNLQENSNHNNNNSIQSNGKYKKNKKEDILAIFKDILIVMFSLPAIILTYEVFLDSNENSNDSSKNKIPKFWVGLLTYICLKIIASRIKLSFIQLSYFSCGFSYLIIKYSLKYGFQTEFISVSIIIFVQQLTDQISQIFDIRIQHFFKSSKLQNNLLEALRLNYGNTNQNDDMIKRQNDSNKDYNNNKVQVLSSSYKKDHETPKMYQPRKDLNLQMKQNSYNQAFHNYLQKSNQILTQNISEYQIPKNHNEKTQTSIQFIRNNSSNPPLKRCATLNQKINELNMGGFYAQLFGLMPVGVAIINSNKNLLYASSQMLQILNCQDEQKALKILLSLNTNAQKSSHFVNQDDTESNEGEEHFYSPANFNTNFPSCTTTNYNQNGNPYNMSEKGSQWARKDLDSQYRFSPKESKYSQQHHSQYQQHNQSQSQFHKNGHANDSSVITPSGYLEDESGVQGINGENEQDDEDNYRTRRSSMQNTNNIGINNNSLNYQIFCKPSHTPLKENGTFDFRNSQISAINESMVDIGTERNQFIPNSQSPYLPSPSIYSSVPSQQLLGCLSAKKIKLKSTQNFSSKDLRDESFVNTPHRIYSQQHPNYLYQQEHEEEENGMVGSIIKPELQINELQFQKPESSKVNIEYSRLNYSPRNGQDSAGIKKSGSIRHNLRQQSVLKLNDNYSDNRTEAQQREESVFNILNLMLGQQSENNITTQVQQMSSGRLRSQKKIQNQQAGTAFNSQNLHACSSQDEYNYNSPQINQQSSMHVKPYLQNQSTSATHSQNLIQQKFLQEQQTTNDLISNSLAKQLEINREKQMSNTKTHKSSSHGLNLINETEFGSGKNQDDNFKEDQIIDNNDNTLKQNQANINVNTNHNANSTLYQNSSKKKQPEENKKDFDDFLSKQQQQKVGYIQQEGNVSTMQIEYLGEQYILKIIIHTVIVGQSQEQKVAIIIMEKMWQDFMIKKVEDLISQKMQLFGSLSHELRTPLNCSISMLEVINNITLSDQRLQNQLSSYVLPALNSNKLLLNMINDILDFVQLDNGSFKFGLVEFDLQNLLKECVSLVQIQAKMKNLTIACYYDPETPKVIKSDPNRIRQVILNFLSNSLKFTVSGHIIVYASAHKSLYFGLYLEFNIIFINIYIYIIFNDKQGVEEIVIGVKDTGIGINQQNIKEIFKVFNKIDLGEKSKLNLQGCGVGLALSNSIARALGPKENQGIQVESIKDQGSTFSFIVYNQNPPIQQQEEDIYQNDEVCDQRLIANFSIIRSKVTQINKQNNKNQKRSRNSSLQQGQAQVHKNQYVTYHNQIQNNNYEKYHQNTTQNSEYNNEQLQNNSLTQHSNQILNNRNRDSFTQLRLSISQINSQEGNIKNDFNLNNNSIPKIGGLDQLNASSDLSMFHNLPDLTSKARSVSLTQVSQSQRKKAINQHFMSSNMSEQQGNDHYNEKQTKSLHHRQHMHHNTTGNPPLSPSRYTSQNGHSSLMSIHNNLNSNIEKKFSLLETIKSKDFQDMHLLDHTKFESPAGFTSYYDDGDQGKIKKSLESIQNNIIQYGCLCPQIIIVDDQEFNLYSLTQLLKQFYGINSDTAINQQQVMQKIANKLNSNCCKTYRIIFMDINMPQKNGYEVALDITKFYHSHKSLTQVKPLIIACSAYNGEEDKKKALAHGMVDFVTKPIMKVALDAIISKYYDFIPQIQLSN